MVPKVTMILFGSIIFLSVYNIKVQNERIFNHDLLSWRKSIYSLVTKFYSNFHHRILRGKKRESGRYRKRQWEKEWDWGVEGERSRKKIQSFLFVRIIEWISRIFLLRTMRIDSDVRRTAVEIKVDGTRGDSSNVRKAPGEVCPMCLSNCQSVTSVTWVLRQPNLNQASWYPIATRRYASGDSSLRRRCDVF